MLSKRSITETTSAEHEQPVKRATVTETPIGSRIDAPSLSLLTPRHIEQLNTLGYTVIEGVLPADVCARRHSALLDEMALRGVNWRDSGVRRSAAPQTHGIVQYLEIGHSQPVWETRQEERVTSVFEQIYGTNDLLTSFDAVCIWRDSDVDDGGTWWHVDQNHAKQGRLCIQGYVNLTNCDGGLSVLPKSHLWHTHAATHLPRTATAGNKDWFKFDAAEFEQMRTWCGTEPTRVLGAVGSMVLWDSRTIHMAQMAPSAAPAPAHQRCVVYTCMQPRTWISPANLRKKCKAFDEHRMTTHWPASKVELFPVNWRTWNRPQIAHSPLPTQRTRVETPRMLELAGKTAMTTRRAKRTNAALEFAN